MGLCRVRGGIVIRVERLGDRHSTLLTTDLRNAQLVSRERSELGVLIFYDRASFSKIPATVKTRVNVPRVETVAGQVLVLAEDSLGADDVVFNVVVSQRCARSKRPS